MDSLLSDIRFGFRQLRNRRGFAAVAILTIALGIGGNIAVFTLVNAVLVNPLTVEDPGRLVNLYTTDSTVDVPGFTLLPTSFRNYESLRETNEAFEELAYSAPVTVVLGGEEPEAVSAYLVSATYFDVLGVRPALGRGFRPEEDELGGGHAVTVLSHALFSRRFASDPSVVGTTIRLNNQPFTVVGVTPPGFRGTMSLTDADVLFVPTSVYDRVLTGVRRQSFLQRRALFINAFGRLKRDVTFFEARAHVAALGAALAEEYASDNRNRGVELGQMADAAYGATPYRTADESRTTRRAATVLMSISALVLLITCVNLANLLLARGTEREKEMALRAELGASPKRILQQLVAENLVLASIGGVAGMGLAAWGRDLLWHLRPPQLASAELDLAFDARTAVFAAGVTLVTGLVFGLLPAILGARSRDLNAKLRLGGRQSGSVEGRLPLRNSLVAAEMALAFMALVTAGLFLRSLAEGRSVDPGFDAEHLATYSFDLAALGYEPERGLAFQREALENVRSIAGVRGAALSQNAPVSVPPYRSVVLEGEVEDPTRFGPAVTANVVSDGYFETLGIALVEGRAIDTGDRASTRPVAVVSRAMANRFFPNGTAVGGRFRFARTETFFEIVGVVEDAVVRSVLDDPIPMVYLASPQNFTPAMVVNVRAEKDVASVVNASRRTLGGLDPNLAITDERLVRDLLEEGLWAPRVGAILLGLFALLALALSAVGVYGVLAQTIGRRTREVGIRLAFGARRRQIYRQLIARGMAPAWIGLLLGIVGSSLVARQVEGLLYRVRSTDTATFLASGVVLMLVALVGCYAPIRRAVNADPMVTLRSE